MRFGAQFPALRGTDMKASPLHGPEVRVHHAATILSSRIARSVVAGLWTRFANIRFDGSDLGPPERRDLVDRVVSETERCIVASRYSASVTAKVGARVI